MRLRAGQTSTEFTLLPWPGTTGGTTHSLYLFETSLSCLHGLRWCGNLRKKNAQFCTGTRIPISLGIAAFRRLRELCMFLSELRTCFGLCRSCVVKSGKCGRGGICGSLKSIITCYPCGQWDRIPPSPRYHDRTRNRYTNPATAKTLGLKGHNARMRFEEGTV